jgi:predicted nuclease of predicted toxin-antitoxin system
MKLLIDECLSPELAKLAQALGHGESSHVVWLNKAGWKDGSSNR